MSETRKKKKGIVMWVIIGLLIIGLGGFGLTGAFQTTGGTAVATVGDQEITAERFINDFQQDIRFTSEQLGRNLTTEEALSFGIDQTSLRRQITLRALANESDRLKISVGNAAVRDALLANPAFQIAEGIFSEATYDLVLNQQRMSREEFENLLREDEAQNLINSAISAGVGPQDTAARVLLDFIGETRDILWAEIDERVLTTETPPPDEAAIQAYYDANPDEFTTPETRRITYAILTPEIITGLIDISDEEVRDFYLRQTAQFNTPAQRILDRLYFPTEQEALDALARIESGEASFQDIADEYQLNLHITQLGVVRAGQLPEAASELLFASNETGMFGPVDTEDGPTLYRVNAAIQEQNLKLADVADDIRTSLAAEQAGTLMLTMIGDIDDLIASGASLEELADETDMELRNIDFNAESTEAIASDQAFVAEALAAEPGEERDLIELESGSIMVLRVDEIIESRLKPLSEARDLAIAGATRVATVKRVQEYADELQARVEAGADLGGTLIAIGLTPDTETGITRTAPPTGLPPLVGQQLFEQDLDEVKTYPSETGAYIVQVNSISPFDPQSENGKAFMAQADSQMRADIATDLYILYANGVVANTEITVNQSIIDQVLNGGLGGAGGPRHVPN